MTALAALAAYVAVSLPFFVGNIVVKIQEAASCAGKDLEGARARVFGSSYVNAIERIRDEIPKDGTYLLADGSGEQGVANWVRFDLAPRRAWFIGRLKGTKRELEIAGRPNDSPRFVVVARPNGEAPFLIESTLFFGGDFPEDRRKRRKDDQIPASIDAPAENASLRGRFVVQGWCQEIGGRPCADIQVYVDGQPLSAEIFERFPRPDVEAVVPGIGKCDRAGYRAGYVLDSSERGPHSVTVFVFTDDGRFRRLGPLKFSWLP